MKKILFMAVALIVCASAFTSCSKDDDDDNNSKETYATLDFEGTAYATLIDTVQYSGPQLYSADTYKWTDSATKLSSKCEKEDWSSWGDYFKGKFGWKNGIAISNYVDADSTANYLKQLSVPVSNGSKNFGVAWDNASEIAFSDSVAHVIKSMQVSPTTYCLNNMIKAAGKDYYFKVIATGIKADNTQSTLDIYLAKDTDVKSTWFDVDMSSLGAVKKVIFTFDGSDKSEYGLSTPKYFALDNVTIVK